MQSITYRMDKHMFMHMFIMHSTRNSIQYSVINHNGKNMKKNVYMYNGITLLCSTN